MVEGAGEDVLLGRLFAAARVKGFQGTALSDADAVLACAKHFAAYGAAEGGLDYNTVDVSERTLREVYFPPFESAFDAGALTAMAAFNEISGVPATGNGWLLEDILRAEWKFPGLVVSDYTGDEELIAHGFAADARAATRIAFMAGVDMSMQSGFYIQQLPDLVAKGEVPMARLDQAAGARGQGKARAVRQSLPPHRSEAREERRARQAASRSRPRCRPAIDGAAQE
jgi:beta-glucosidase